MRYAYREWSPNPATLIVIAQAEAICEDYAAQGYSLTLRQLYYQFVQRGLIENTFRNYKRIGTIVDQARYAGLLDWDHIVDRTRELEQLPHWGLADDKGADSAHGFVRSVLPQYRVAKWSTQPVRVEAWVEKEALIDVLKRPSDRLDIPYFACRGYVSSSSAHEAAVRLEGYLDEGAERVLILHLGDHDPEGIDMTRDIDERLALFLSGDGYDESALEVRRIALNMDQVQQYNPPPNFAKETSSRYQTYMRRFGPNSWELDALDPPTIDALITAEVMDERDEGLWDEAVVREAEGTRILTEVTRRWGDVVRLVGG